MIFTSKEMEFRGYETGVSGKTGQAYHLYHIEEIATGKSYQFYVKDTSLVAGIKKGDIVTFDIEIKEYKGDMFVSGIVAISKVVAK